MGFLMINEENNYRISHYTDLHFVYGQLNCIVLQ